MSMFNSALIKGIGRLGAAFLIRISPNKRTYVVLAAVFFAVVLVLPAVTPTFNFLNVSSDWMQSAFAAKDKDKKPNVKITPVGTQLAARERLLRCLQSNLIAQVL